MDYNFVKPSHYQLITKEEAKFIFEQGEKHLKDQIDTSQQIGTKTTTLLTVISGVLIGLISFGISRWASSGFDILIATTICSCIYLYVVVILLLKNIKPNLYQSVGLHPRRIFDDVIFNSSNHDYRMEMIYVNEIIECQKRIDFNQKANDARWHRFNLALRLISYSPGVFLLFYSLINLFSFLRTTHPGCGL